MEDSPPSPLVMRTRFRPCIDLRAGKVVQIVGGTLRDGDSSGVRVNHESDRPASAFAALYRQDGLTGGHVIQLGSGNEESARAALEAWPGGLQIGGGIGLENARSWIEAGASHVIVTSYLFDGASFCPERLEVLKTRIGRERLVVDLSCRRLSNGWAVATNRWQTVTDFLITPENLDRVSQHCAELLIHAADVEGQCQGIDEELVELLGKWAGSPVTYAGGARGLQDLRLVDVLSGGRVDLTIGSALDLFGGTGVTYAECVDWNRRCSKTARGEESHPTA